MRWSSLLSGGVWSSPASPTVLLLVAVLSAVIQESAGVITCHYCGIEDLCPLPYNDVNRPVAAGAKVAKKLCAKACLKFDGHAPDGKRVVIRDCGGPNADTNKCTEDFEFFGAKGNMCYCNAGNCNGAERRAANVGVILAGAMAAAVVVAARRRP